MLPRLDYEELAKTIIFSVNIIDALWEPSDDKERSARRMGMMTKSVSVLLILYHIFVCATASIRFTRSGQRWYLFRGNL